MESGTNGTIHRWIRGGNKGKDTVCEAGPVCGIQPDWVEREAVVELLADVLVGGLGGRGHGAGA